MSNARLIELVAGWVESTLVEFPEEEIRWDVTFQAFPDASNEERWIPQIAIYFEITGPAEGTSVFGVPMLRPYAMDAETVAGLTRDALKDMIAEREKSIDQLTEK